MIKVLVVDDSQVQREYHIFILNSDPDISVIGSATNGEEAVRAVKKLKPDVIVMDIHMPKMNGIEATKEIMATNPTPIVIVSSSDTDEETLTPFYAIEAGAVAVAEKPGLGKDPISLIKAVKTMSEVKVLRRKKATPTPLKSSLVNKNVFAKANNAKMDVKFIAIGASTGGPPVLQTLLRQLPDNLPPILIVQHITPGFLPGLIDWLVQTTNKTIQIARHGEQPLPNHIYLAPDNFQMGIDIAGSIFLSNDSPQSGLRPSVSFLFNSIAKTYADKTIAILLTGMGKDGAEGLKLLHDKGSITIAQDKESCIVYGMPAVAVELGAVQYSLTPENMVSVITDFCSNNT